MHGAMQIRVDSQHGSEQSARVGTGGIKMLTTVKLIAATAAVAALQLALAALGIEGPPAIIGTLALAAFVAPTF
jgi:hypothetical protein